jgi:hypothetical protein
LTATATTDKSTYVVNAKGGAPKVQITTTVLNGGTPVSNVVVSVRVTDPAGAVSTGTKNTDGHGKGEG